jgi:hypothetical protein
LAFQDLTFSDFLSAAPKLERGIDSIKDRVQHATQRYNKAFFMALP